MRFFLTRLIDVLRRLHEGQLTGDVVYAGIVSRGASVTVKGGQLWIRFGAVGNLDLVLNGKPVRPTHTGTVDAVVTPNGLGA